MTTLVPQTFIQGVAHNAEVMAKSGSTYVVVVFSALAALFLALSTAQQDSLLANFPFLKGYTPIIVAVLTFLVTRLKPSSAVSKDTQALIDEISRMKMNQMLTAAGQPTIPEPKAIPVPPASITPPVVPPVAVPEPPAEVKFAPTVPFNVAPYSASPAPAPAPDPMQTNFNAPPNVVDIPLPLGASASQPIHLVIHLAS